MNYLNQLLVSSVRKLNTVFFCAVTVFCFFHSSANAHHSTAMFDHTKSVTIVGTVKEVQWTNPHVAIFINGSVGGEEPSIWLMEMTSPGNLVRDGWTRTAVKAGDKVTVSFSPLRDATKGKGGALKKLVLTDSGKAFTADIRAAERPNIGEEPEK